jgi:hypothetical protein
MPGGEHVLQVLPAMVDELGIHDDLVDLALGAVAAHVGLLEYVVKVGILVHAVDDVVEDLLLALSARAVLPAEHDSFQEGSLFGHAYYLLLLRLRG